MGSVQRLTHLCIPSRQHPVLMQTSPLRHWLELVHVRRLQHLFTQTLLPSVVLMQAHCFVVFVHATTHPVLVPAGHVGGAALASLAATPSPPATPNSAAPANLSARRLVMVPLANSLAKSSKGRPDLVAASSSTSSPPPCVEQALSE